MVKQTEVNYKKERKKERKKVDRTLGPEKTPAFYGALGVKV